MPTSTVRCVNGGCPHYRVDRFATLVEVGDGLYVRSHIECECGEAVRVMDRRVDPVKAGPDPAVGSPTPPERAVVGPPERRKEATRAGPRRV